MAAVDELGLLELPEDDALLALEEGDEEAVAAADISFDLASDALFDAVQAGDREAFRGALRDALDALIEGRDLSPLP